MREADFEVLEKRLQERGIAARHAQRVTSEMRDHYEDLVDGLTGKGASTAKAHQLAGRDLGSMDDFIAAMSARRELKSWAYRFPHLAIVAYPIAYLVALPARPVIAGVENAPVVARWGASLLAAGLFTAALMLVLQLSILFG